MFGKKATNYQLLLNLWGFQTHLTVLAFEDDPLRQEQCVRRKFEERHDIVNKLRQEIGVAKKDFTDNGWKGFINVSLTSEQKEQLSAWDIQDGDVWDGIATYCETGYKVSVSYNFQNKNFTATLIGGEGSNKNAGRAVSAFAPTPYQAVRTMLFKVSVMLPPVWTEYKASIGDDIG